MSRRLRLAIEIDCDARVIRAGVAPRDYGILLLSVGERFATSLPLAASLTEPHLSLEARIDALSAPRAPRPLLASIPFLAIAVVALTAATRAPRPRPLLTRTPIRARVPATRSARLGMQTTDALSEAARVGGAPALSASAIGESAFQDPRSPQASESAFTYTIRAVRNPALDSAGWQRIFESFDGVVTFVAGRGRFDVLEPASTTPIATRGRRVPAPIAAPGDYYLFDSTGCILVRPSSKSFSYHPFFNSQELWADRHVDETGNPARPRNSIMPVFWFGVSAALAQNWKADGHLPSGHTWLSAFGSELPAEIYVKTSALSVIPQRSVDLSRFVLPDGFTEASWAGLAPKLDSILRGSGVRFQATDVRSSTSSPDVGERWRRPPTPSTQAARDDTIPVIGATSNADIQPLILIPRILLDQRTTIGANGRVRFPIVPTESEVSAGPDRTREQTGKLPAKGDVRDTTSRITVDFQQTDIREVLRVFADFSGRTIVVGKGVTGSVTASIKDQPWKAALSSILQSRGLIAVEDSTGVITVAHNSDNGGGPRIGSAFTGVGYVLKAPQSDTSSACRLFLVDGVVVYSPCAVPTEKSDVPKCDPAAPVFVIDGVIQSAPCGKPEPRDFFAWFTFAHKPR